MRPKTGVEVLPMVDTGTADLWQSDCHQGGHSHCRQAGQQLPMGDTTTADKGHAGQLFPVGDTATANPNNWTRPPPGGHHICRHETSWASSPHGGHNH